MKIRKYVLMAIVLVGFVACDNHAEEVEPVVIVPEALQQVDDVLSTFSMTPQRLSTSGKKQSLVTGARGTIIHIDPSKLETVDGSPIGNTIDIALLEIGDKVNMMLNNVTTMAGDKLLESGGAFYIKMWSKGVELRIKKDEALEIEFPKWIGAEMELFDGNMDSLGQIGWKETGVSFAEKNIAEPEKPVNPEDSKNPEDISKQEYNSYLLAMQDYKKRQQQISDSKKTYQANKISHLGWYSGALASGGDGPKTSIELMVREQEEMSRARFFAVIKDKKSVMAVNYRKGNKGSLVFQNIPEGEEITIIGVSVKNGQALIYQQNVRGAENLKLEVEFMPASPEELRRAISTAS